jgi:hypothetical protein
MFTPILLPRDKFRSAVFKRDSHTCVFCENLADTAHHILERRLWSDGGYYVENGASVCEQHHLECEMTIRSVEEVREAAGITRKVIPDHLYDDVVYDKWGNVILPTGQRMKGELFSDTSVQKILEQGRVLDLFVKYYKYPRTYHLPWSPGVNDDDKVISDINIFRDHEVVITEKLDGENCLDSNTLIHTSKGDLTIKEICDNHLDVSVLSRNIETNTDEYQKIIATNIASESDDWYEIETETGGKIICTGEHLLWVENEKCYKKVIDLKGDEIIRLKAG